MRRFTLVLALCLCLASCSSDDGAEAAGSTTDSSTTTVDTTAVSSSAVSSSAVSSTAVPTTAEPDAAATGCGTGGVSDITVAGDGNDRSVRVFVPTAWDGSSLLPMVVNWHGLGSNGPDQAAYTDYEALAEREGFIVVHPTGDAGVIGIPNWELSQFPDPTKDDVAFANALLDEMIASFCADPAAVYSTGMSNGGLFTSVLVCEMGDRLAGAASVAGTTHADDCVADDPVPYIAFHGTADRVVSFDGSSDNGELFSEVTPAEFGEFAADFGCDPEPTSEQVSDEVIRYDYLGCRNEVPLSFYEIVGGGHTWPGAELDLGGTTQDIDATADAWAFFARHRLDD